MKKIYERLWYLLLFGFLFGAPLLYFLAGPYLDRENYENRTLTQAPELSPDSIRQFPEAFEAYYNDAMPFRNYLVRADSAISYYLFHDSSSDDVIAGKDGWLFFTGEDGKSLEQYLGRKRYTKKELRLIAENLVTTRDYLAERGCEFVLAIAPNKERVYQEYMPDAYGSFSSCCTDQLLDYLRKHTDLRVLWLEDDLKAYRQEHPEDLLYYRLDTHWNLLGGYIGARAVLKELGVTIPEPSALEKTKKVGSPADLARLLNLRNELMDSDMDYVLADLPAPALEIEMEDGNTFYRYHRSGKDGRKLLVWRDSFCDAMRYVLAGEFNESCMVKGSYFTKDVVEAEAPDLFVMELVERTEDYLKEFVLREDTP